MKQTKRIISLLLALCLCLSMVPVRGRAADSAAATAAYPAAGADVSVSNGTADVPADFETPCDHVTESPLSAGAQLPTLEDGDLCLDGDVYVPQVSFVDNSVEPANYTSCVTSTDDLNSRLQALISKYQNTYWTQSGNACSSHTSTCYSRYYYAWQCKGFAGYIFNDLFCGGSIGPYADTYYYIPSPNNATLVGKASGYSSTDTATVKGILEKAQPGDFIQTRRRNKNYGHSMIVVSVNDSGVYLFDCNSDGKCGVKYYHQTWETFASKNSGMSLYHSTKYPGVSPCNCSTSYAGYYTCTTTSSNLTIRSGHGTSYGAVGKIPPGATVYVSKANGSWAHVEYNGISGFASMDYLEPQSSSAEVDARISQWLSHDAMGDSISSAKVGEWVYLCYRMYDANSGDSLNVAVPDRTYTVTETIYNPDGSVRHTYTYNNADSNWLGIRCLTSGTYTYEIIIEGDWSATVNGSFVVDPNPMEIHASSNEVELTLGSTESEVIYVWATGYNANAYYFSWGKSNDNVSCSWGDWEDDLVPLTISANSPGTTTITLSVHDDESTAVLDTYTVYVTVIANTYTISYNANGGSGAPASQTKTNGVTLTLSSTVPTRFGYNFKGWATSASATSASYQPGGSFTTNANTTLYAVWAAPNEMSGNYGEYSRNPTISYAGQGVYYKFIPNASTYYRFYATGDTDNKIYLYDANGTQLATDDDSGGNRQFKLEYNCTANTTYYVYVRLYSSSSTGSVPFTVSKRYTISYDANGGSGAPSAQYKYYGFDLVLSSTVPTRSGYTFQGWATSSTATTAEYQPGDTYTQSGSNRTLYAVWSQSQYTVSYNANGGSGAPASQTKSGGIDLTLSTTVPTRFGYTFLGWSTSSTATTATYLPGGTFNKNANTTLYAVWQSSTVISSGVTNSSYSAAISFANGTKYYIFTPSFSGKIQLESTGTGDTRVYVYDASGTQLGYNDDSGADNNFLLTQSVTSGTTYYVMVRHYSSGTGTINFTVKRAYDITYNANGGSGAPSAQVKVYGTNLTLSTTKPSRSGYTFQGWATSSTATSASYQAGSSFSTNANTTLYAVWKANTYTVTYNANGGTGAPSNQTKTHGVTLTLSTTKPSRSGYTFQGWATSSSATSAAYQPGGSFTTNANTTLYAVWKANTYTISYNANGGSGAPASQTKTHGVALTLCPTEPTRPGYTFLGWATSSTATTATYQPGSSFTTNANTILYAVWKANTYTISYNANGGSGAPSSQTKTHGVTLTLSTTKPTRSGYTFQGWATSSSATTAAYQPGGSFTTNANTTLYAVWTSSNLASGTCGSNLTWTLSQSGVLTVSGSGTMKDYTYKSEMPWYSHRSQIKSVVVESGVTSIGAYAFYGMPNMESIAIPQSVTAIGSYAFKNATALDDVILPAKLSKLGESAFYGCTALTAIDIPASLYTVQPYTFKNCTALAEVTFHEGNLQKISDGAFYGTGLTELVLPDCMSILDMYSFKNCAKLRSIQLGSGLTQIREAVFYGTAIPTISIPEGVTSIGPYAFKNCTRLVRIDLPSTLTSVGEASFYACTALESLDLPDAVTKIGNYAFRKCAALLDVSLGANLVTIGESSFYGCESIVYLRLPSKVTTIQGYAFKGCTDLEFVTLPGSLTTLGDSAFHTCTSLSEVTIPAKVTKIGEYCFSGSTGIDYLYFLGNAPAIGTGAFNKITATAYYPSGNATWTASVRQNYGGSISWVAQ